MKIIIIDNEELKDIFNTKYSITATDKEVVVVGNMNLDDLLTSVSNVIAQSYKTLKLVGSDISKKRYLSEVIYMANSILSNTLDVDLPIVGVTMRDKDNNVINGYINIREHSIQSLEGFIENNLADMEDFNESN